MTRGLRAAPILAAHLAACGSDGVPAAAPVGGSTLRIPAGAGPASVALLDVDGDRRLDLVVANDSGDDASLRFGDGQGAFSSERRLRAGTMPVDIAAGDFDADGRPDLAFANHETSLVTVLLAAGGFAPAPGSPFPSGGRPHIHSVGAGDLDADGHLDLVTESVDTDTVQVLFGEGGGRFAPGIGFRAGRRPYFRLRVADVDADQRPDVIVPNSGEGTLSVLVADGRGGLVPMPGSPFAAGREPFSVAAGDFDGDGRVDLASAHPSQGSVSVLLAGAVGFRPAAGSPFRAGSDPTNLATGDVDGDGVVDLAVSNFSSNDVALLLSDRRATPGARVRMLPVGRRPQGLALGDLDDDGRADLVVANFLDNDVSVWLSVP